MKLTKAVIAVTLAGLWALGCSNSSSPTSTSGFTLVISMGLENSAQKPTIVAAQLLFDGVTALIGSPPAAAAFVSLQTTAAGISSGNHTVTAQISIQTSSPNSYSVTSSSSTPAPPSITVFDGNQNLLKTIPLTIQTANLATGQGITYSFSL
jgi:hypothetical protein